MPLVQTMKMKRITLVVAAIALLLTLALMTLVPAYAQGESIGFGENRTGSIDEDTPSAEYNFLGSEGQSATVQVLSITPDFVPEFTVNDEDGSALSAPANVQTTVELPADGTYTIEIVGTDDGTGQFVVSLSQASGDTTVLPSTPIEAGVEIEDTVDEEAPARVYTFDAEDDTVSVITVSTDNTETPLSLSLENVETGETTSILNTSTSNEILIPSGGDSYALTVDQGDATGSQTYTILLGPLEDEADEEAMDEEAMDEEADEEAMDEEEEPMPVPTRTPVPTARPSSSTGSTSGGTTGGSSAAAAPAPTCFGTMFNAGSFVVRTEPNFSADVAGLLTSGVEVPITGTSEDGEWFRVTVGGATGWTPANILRLSGDCVRGSVPAASSSAAPAPAPAPAPATTTDVIVEALTGEAPATSGDTAPSTGVGGGSTAGTAPGGQPRAETQGEIFSAIQQALATERAPLSGE